MLAKIDEDHAGTGHITSLSVMRTHRRLGLAEKLMRQATRAMHEYYGARDVSLHVRCSNEAAIGLYTHRLGFARDRVEKGYYADGEDAWCMRLDIAEATAAAAAKQAGAQGTAVEKSNGAHPDDEGGEVGEAGSKADMRRVKVGRGLGVGDLVERNETQQSRQDHEKASESATAA